MSLDTLKRMSNGKRTTALSLKETQQEDLLHTTASMYIHHNKMSKTTILSLYIILYTCSFRTGL